jgi:hypothetical protein
MHTPVRTKIGRISRTLMEFVAYTSSAPGMRKERMRIGWQR